MSQSTLSDVLKSSRPREDWGSKTANRYDFQANVAILKLLELSGKAGNYCLAFDLFDDLMLLDTASNPTEVRFYQIKSKDPGDWKTSALCAALGATPPCSYVSRMYQHVHAFGHFVAETGFISNAPYILVLSDETRTSGEHHRITGDELSDDEIARLRTAVISDYPDCNVDTWLPKLSFIRVALGVHEQRPVIVGYLQEYLEKLTDRGSFKTGALYDTIHSTIIERTKYTVAGLDFNDFFARKSITRSEFDNLIARALSTLRGPMEDWNILALELSAYGFKSIEQIRIKTGAFSYIAERASGRPEAVNLCSILRGWFSGHPNRISEAPSVLELAQEACNAIPPMPDYTSQRLLGCCLVEAYEAIGGY